MGKMQRQKGQRGEREICKLLQPVLDLIRPEIDLSRNLVQARNGGYDIVGLESLAIEVKRGEILKIDQWWEQCRSQAIGRKIPILAYRQNRRKWRFVVPGSLFGYDMVDRLETGQNDFLRLFRELLLEDVF